MEPLTCQEVGYETIDVSKQTGIVGASSVKLNLPPIQDSEFPTVSVVIPTYNRQLFFSLILRNWQRIDYPRELLELVILDDSDNIPINAPVPEMFANDPQIHYYRIGERMTIGQKRNALCELAKHKYIVHMDDDDWYPPESVAARIRVLLEFQKSIGGLAAVGCSKVLCLDLISNQMFEAFDESKTGDPATLSESTMAYSKDYWVQQQWDSSSKFAECLPFLNGRHQTVCVLPSVFVVTQFTHGRTAKQGYNPNTVERRVSKNSVSEYNAIRFQGSLSAYDTQVFNKIRANVVRKLPDYREAIGFVQKCQGLNHSQLKKFLKKTRSDYKKRRILYNPLVIDFVRENMVSKTTTTGKDIVYYCGPGDHFKFSSPWNPESTTLGGSEEAVIHLTTRWAELGYNVTVYCVLSGPPKKFYGVNYRNYWEWIPKDKQDVTVIWRDPSNCKHVMEHSGKVFLDLHDALDPVWLQGLHKDVVMMVKSHYHKQILKIPRATVVPNGIEPIGINVQKKKNLMICTSSPDRCLRALLRAMPLIRQEVPDAEIHWAYGFKSGVSKGGMEKHSSKEVRNWVKDSKELIANTPGFKDLGRLTQGDVKKLYQRADLFVYPTRFPEIDCISLTKAMSAGTIPIVTPAGAMAEKMGIKSQVANVYTKQVDTSLEDGEYFQQFVAAVIQTLKSQQTEEQRMRLSVQANHYSWNGIVQEWLAQMFQKEELVSRKRARPSEP